MDENEFLRGLEGETQQGTDLVSGAEHLVRLKIQSGQQTQQQYPDLELKKEAMHGGCFGPHKLKKEADLSESIGSAAMCKGCGKVKEACGCSTKMASYNKAKDALKHLMRTNPMARAAILGGTVSAVGSAALGAASAPPGDRIGSGLRSGVMGGIAGAGTGALYHHLSSKVASQPDWDKTMLAATTGLGALAGGIGTYLSSRPQKDTGKSKMEEDLEGAVAAQKLKPERGFLEKIKNRETESAHGLSRVFREHPVKGSLLGAVTGASLGYGLGQLGGAIARRGGK